MKLTLRGYGNPDYRQYTDIAPKQTVEVSTLADAVKACRDYIQKYELGGGNWGKQSGIVTDGGKQIARISANGRVWEPGEYPTREICVS